MKKNGIAKIIKGIGGALVLVGIAIIFGTAGSSDLGLISMPQIVMQGLTGVLLVINGAKILRA